MSIKVKAVERNVSFDKNVEKWAYVMQAELYSKLSQSKVTLEAALRSGISKGSILHPERGHQERACPHGYLFLQFV